MKNPLSGVKNKVNIVIGLITAPITDTNVKTVTLPLIAEKKTTYSKGQEQLYIYLPVNVFYLFHVIFQLNNMFELILEYKLSDLYEFSIMIHYYL